MELPPHRPGRLGHLRLHPVRPLRGQGGRLGGLERGGHPRLLAAGPRLRRLRGPAGTGVRCHPGGRPGGDHRHGRHGRPGLRLPGRLPDAGAADYVDAVAYHPYPETLGPPTGYTPKEELMRNWWMFRALAHLQVHHKHLEVWLTEFGWTTHTDPPTWNPRGRAKPPRPPTSCARCSTTPPPPPTWSSPTTSGRRSTPPPSPATATACSTTTSRPSPPTIITSASRRSSGRRRLRPRLPSPFRAPRPAPWRPVPGRRAAPTWRWPPGRATTSAIR